MEKRKYKVVADNIRNKEENGETDALSKIYVPPVYTHTIYWSYCFLLV